MLRFFDEQRVRIAGGWLVLAALIASCDAGGGTTRDDPPPPPNETLAITPAFQQTPEWCWAAVSEMVLEYYGYPALNPDFQCGLVAVTFGGVCLNNCFNCQNQSIGTATNLQLAIYDYGPAVYQWTGYYYPPLKSTVLFAPLPMSTIKASIAHGHPIVAGISPSGFSIPNVSQHATLIVGYDTTGPIERVIVNDPFPYDLPIFGSVPNPYTNVGGSKLQPGQYEISLQAFVENLVWANTEYGFAQ